MSDASASVAFFVSPRFLLGYYSADGGQKGIGRKTLFPRRDVPVVDSNQCLTEPWYRILQFMYEKKLGGDLAKTLPQIQGATQNVADGLTVTVGAISNITQTIETNAASAAQTISTLQSAGTPGAASIPQPILEVPAPPPPPSRPTQNDF